MARLTAQDAALLGLQVHALLCWDLQRSVSVRIRPETVVTHLVYGLDDFQGVTLVKVDPTTEPPEVTLCKSGQGYSGVPIRPLYWDVAKGMSRRAIPLDWRSGISYDDWRTKVPVH
jgi:hypothetical protein